MGSNSVGSGQPPVVTNANSQAVADALKAQLEAAELSAKLNAMLGIGTFLTAEDMFQFAQQQLTGIDAEIRTHITGITIAKEKAAVMQGISAGLRSVKNSTNAEQVAKFDEAIAQAKQAGMPELANKLTEEKAKVVALGSDAATSDFIEGTAQHVDSLMTSLTSSSELTMIRIQGLMQQRSQVLQLASNVIAALNEPAKNAIGNLRS